MPGFDSSFILDKLPMTIEQPVYATGAEARCAQAGEPGGPTDAALVPWGCEEPCDGRSSWWAGAR